MDIHDLKIFLTIAQEGSVSKLCSLHIPICYQCDRNETDDGLCSKYGTSDAIPSVCSSDRDNYCSSTCCLYLCSFHGGYFQRKEIKDLTGQIKKGKLKFIKNMSDEGRPRHRKGPKKQSVR